jgi:endonuclease/exonuclease/phosphatase (EEP) superfamily protein YafD
MGQTRSDQRDSASTRLIIRVATLSVFLAAMLTLAAFGARWHWLCELIVHWRVQITLAAAIACVVLLLKREWKCALFGGAVALANASYVAPLFLPQRHDTASGPTWRAVSANVHTSNRDARPFLEFIRSARPDFTLVIEIDDWWQRALKDLDRDYPHSVVRPQSGRSGIALFSRHPIVSHRVVLLDDSREPTLISGKDSGPRSRRQSNRQLQRQELKASLHSDSARLRYSSWRLSSHQRMVVVTSSAASRWTQ